MIAFSDYVRTIIWLIYKYLITITVIKSGLYDRVYLHFDWKSRDLVRKVEDRVTKMKAEVKAARQRRTRAHKKSPDTVDKDPHGGDRGDGGSGSGTAAARLGSAAPHGADAGASATSGPRLRTRPSQPDAEGPDHHVVQISDFAPASAR